MGEGRAANAQSTVPLLAKIPLPVTRTATSYRPPQTSQPKLSSHPVSSRPPPPQAAPPKPGVVSIPPPHIAVLSYPKCPRSSAASLAHLQTTHRTSGLHCAARNGWMDHPVLRGGTRHGCGLERTSGGRRSVGCAYGMCCETAAGEP